MFASNTNLQNKSVLIILEAYVIGIGLFALICLLKNLE